MLGLRTAAKLITLGIEPRRVTPEALGFHIDRPHVRSRINTIVRAFVYGYEQAMVRDDLLDVNAAMLIFEAEVLGFAFEGAAMALALRDNLGISPRSRWSTFLAGPGKRHAYMLHIGAGRAFGRLRGGRRRLDEFLKKSDPLLRWLIVDGYGFHHGFSGCARILGGRRPRFAHPYAARAFDQGLGRSLWVVEGMEVERVVRRVDTFPVRRHGDLWSGVGLAAGYAGFSQAPDLQRLGHLAGPSLPQLQQGVAFAATARVHAGNMAPHTEDACRVLCGRSAEELAKATELARRNLGPDGASSQWCPLLPRSSPQYEVWRNRVALACAATVG
jgi:enediyne biosynthesis protein E3